MYPPKNMQEVRVLINKILPYSAIKRKANSPPPYSILKPDTSSDSPSAKSNGARLVSASLETSHITKIGNIAKKKYTVIWLDLITQKSKDKFTKTKTITTKAILTSYEIV